MHAFAAMLLTLRIGLVPSPTDGAVLSIRETALQAAQDVAARDTFVAFGAPSRGGALRAAFHRPEAPLAVQEGWAAPALVADVQKEQQRQRWRSAIAETLNGNQKIANAAMWLAAAPLRLKVSPERVFVAITIRTP
jgi:hypothetical protein